MNEIARLTDGKTKDSYIVDESGVKMIGSVGSTNFQKLSHAILGRRVEARNNPGSGPCTMALRERSDLRRVIDTQIVIVAELLD